MDTSKSESIDSSSSTGERKTETQSRLTTTAQTTSTSSTSSVSTTSTPSTFVNTGTGDQSSATATQRRTPSPPKRNSTPSQQDVSTSSTSTTTPSVDTPGATTATSTTTTQETPAGASFTGTTTTKKPEIPASTTSTVQPTTKSSMSHVGSTSTNPVYTQHYKHGTMVVPMKRPSSDVNAESRAQSSDSSGDPKRKKIRKEPNNGGSGKSAADGNSGDNTSVTLPAPTPAGALSSGNRARGSTAKPKVTFAGLSGPRPGGRLTMIGHVAEEKMVFFAGGPTATTSANSSSTSTTVTGSSAISTATVSTLQSNSGSDKGSSTQTNTSGACEVGSGEKLDTPSTTHGGNNNNSNSNSSGSGSNWGAGLKVPPIKIVLQSNSHGQGGSNLSSSNNESENQSGNRQDGHGHGHSPGSGGFHYVVSSTTAETSETKEKDTPTTGSPPLTGTTANNSEPPTASTATTTATVSATPSASSITATTSLLTTVTVSSTSATTTGGTSVTTTTALTSVPVTQGSVSATADTPAARPPPKSAGERKGLPAVAVTIASQHLLGSNLKDDKERQGTKMTLTSTTISAGPATSAAVTVASGNTSTSTSATSSPAVVVTTAETSGVEEPMVSSVASTTATTTTATTQPQTGKEQREKPHRVTRSSQRIATTHGQGQHSNSGATSTSATLTATNASSIAPNSPANGNSPKTSACPSPSNAADGGDSTGATSTQGKSESVEKMDATENANVPSADLHPRKRKIKTKEPGATAGSSSSSTSGDTNDIGTATAGTSAPTVPGGQTQGDQPVLNCFEMFLNIRKQIDRRRKNMFPVQPKPPQGFKDYLMNRGTYVLANTANARLAVPFLNPPQSMSSNQMKELFIDQEKLRHKLRLQHLVEKEKLVLSVEQEILRVHGRAARALSNQSVPFSVCTILKDQEVYNLLTPEQEEKDRNARSRYNGRLFISWLQDVDDKWDKIKESMLLRHHNESESLHAVQKMDWEWKLKEVGLCEPKSTAVIDDLHVPMVHVSDDFDLLPG